MNNYSILIVDDNENNIFTLKSIINLYLNVDIIEALSGDEALKLVLKKNPDLIILDVNMPIMDGFEVAKILKHKKKTEDIPIIFLTAEFKKEEFKKHGFEIGAIDYLVKPIDDYQLINRIKVYMQFIKKEREKNAELEHLVEKRTLDLQMKLEENEKLRFKLQTSQKEAETANYYKTIFLANMTHDLRTPINGIFGISELLSITELTDEQKEYVDFLKVSASTLTELLEQILDISRIESGKILLDLKPATLTEIITDVIKMMEYKIKLKGLEFIYNLDNLPKKQILCDKVKIKRILLNILNNSFKFTEKGYIKFDISLSDNDENTQTLLISIEDTGIGIEKSNFEKIFHEFEQGNRDINIKYGGVGLGLSIVKKFIDLMEGSISLESNIGKGTIFYITIPCKKTDE